MKKLFPFIILSFIFGFAFPTFSFAQGMMGNNMMNGNNAITQSDDGLPAEALALPKPSAKHRSAQAGHTARGEAEGKEIWEKLQAKELTCEDLSDDDFHSLGMHFMGVMVGDSHEAMDTMMEQMMGQEGENQMHIAMGKRMSNCEPNAPIPQNMMDSGMIPMMMNMMMGGGMMGGNNSMMGNFATNPTGWFGWGLGLIFMILFWGLIILAIVALIKWIVNQGTPEAKSRPALDILKERYAKGEIDKKEFEEKKKDLV